jgi:hypothetical protein
MEVPVSNIIVTQHLSMQSCAVSGKIITNTTQLPEQLLLFFYPPHPHRQQDLGTTQASPQHFLKNKTETRRQKKNATCVLSAQQLVRSLAFGIKFR